MICAGSRQTRKQEETENASTASRLSRRSDCAAVIGFGVSLSLRSGFGIFGAPSQIVMGAWMILSA